MPVEVVRWSDAVEVPWKNGGGVTRELVVQGEGPFEWRLSAATIDADGPFSEFAGIDRVLVLLRGAGVDLDIDGSSVRLDRPGAGVAFSGEAGVMSRLVDGATVDLNLMTRRDLYSQTWSVGPASDPFDTSSFAIAIVHVLDGGARVDGETLGVGDSAWWTTTGRSPVLGGSGSLVRFGLGRRA